MAIKDGRGGQKVRETKQKRGPLTLGQTLSQGDTFNREPFNQVSRVKQNTYKSVVDTWNGYHIAELDEESRNLTAFITPYGKYQYSRALKGHVCSVDAYMRRAGNITKDVYTHMIF